MSSQSKNLPINYYKLKHPKGGFCILSFHYSDPVVADHIAQRVIRYNINYGRISQEQVFKHTLKHFDMFRIGAICFYVGSRDPIRYISFFYSRFVDGFVEHSDALQSYDDLLASLL